MFTMHFYFMGLLASISGWYIFTFFTVCRLMDASDYTRSGKLLKGFNVDLISRRDYWLMN
jgi:hypothetical protein